MRALLILGWFLPACHSFDGDASVLSSDLSVLPPPTGPDLHVGWLSPGAWTGVTVTGISEGDEVHLARSGSTGSGPCWALLDGLCLDLVPPVRRFPVTYGQPGGWAYVPVRVPMSAALGRPVSLQAVVFRDEGVLLTPAQATSIEEAGGCIALWDPVCGLDGVTYSNTCDASMAGMVIDYEGTC